MRRDRFSDPACSCAAGLPRRSRDRLGREGERPRSAGIGSVAGTLGDSGGVPTPKTGQHADGPSRGTARRVLIIATRQRGVSEPAASGVLRGAQHAGRRARVETPRAPRPRKPERCAADRCSRYAFALRAALRDPPSRIHPSHPIQCQEIPHVFSSSRPRAPRGPRPSPRRGRR